MVDPEACARAVSLRQLGRFEEAIDLLGRLLADAPDDAGLLTELALALLGADDPERALEQARRACAAAPDAGQPRLAASLAARRLDRHDEAVDQAETAVTLMPLHPGASVMLAEALLARPHRGRGRGDDLARAQIAAGRAAQLAPDDPDARFVVARVLAARGDRVGAEATYRDVLSMRPDHPQALNNLAGIRLGSARALVPSTVARPEAHADAARGFADAVAADPRNAVARRNLDQVTRGFLVSLAWLVVIDAQITRALRLVHAPTLRLVPLLPLLLAAVTASRYIARLTPPLRAHLRRIVVVERQLSVAVACLALGATGIAAGCLTSPTTAATLLEIAGGPAVVGYLALRLHTDRHTRPASAARQVQRSGILWLIAVGLAILGAAGIHVLKDGAAHTAALAFTLACFTGAGTALVVIVRRRVRRV